MAELTAEELTRLIRAVFPAYEDDRRLAVLVDVPARPAADNDDWRDRRRLAREWARTLQTCRKDLDLEDVALVAYADVGSNNADLPSRAFRIDGDLPPTADKLAEAGTSVDFDEVFASHQLFLAPTEYSTTAPLKNAARRFGFRTATMPGFSATMIPALRIDYTEVNRRVMLIKERLDAAEAARVIFRVDGRDEYRMHFDLRHREAHASSGRFPARATAGNLPSGEAYIVPYEGDHGEESLTAGTLPVQVGEEVVLFQVTANRADRAEGTGPAARAEGDHLRREPAYGNMAELGFGVLGDFGLSPTGEILLDEKLGFHVAFGRSDHFGGAVGPGDFSSPQAVIHLDRIYIPATQPRVTVVSLVLVGTDGRTEEIMHDGQYLVFD